MKQIKFVFLFAIAFYMAGCSSRGVIYNYTNTARNGSYSAPPGYARSYQKATMRPYTVRGVTYYPTVVHVGDIYNGTASWYGPNFHGRLTSDGEVYNMYALTAANKILPMNTIVRVTNKNNGRSVVVRINDRGPFVASRIIDLSKAAAERINMIGTGTAPVRLEVLGFAGKHAISIPTQDELDRGPRSEVLSKFAVQIGSFIHFRGARETQSKYNGFDGYTTIIKDMDENGQRVYKVWLTGFKSEAEARDFKARGLFPGAFIVKEE
jgi:rare lipoprotein A